MSLALAAAIASFALIIASQFKRRMKGAAPALDWIIKGLAAIVILLVVAYFYQRVIA